MEKSKLHEQWGARDDRRLASKTISSRLPVHILARIMSICDLYPNRTRSDIINDLLNAGLSVFENELPASSFKCPPEEFMEDSSIFPFGAKTSYRKNANKHYRELEAELGNNNEVFSDLFSHNELREC